MGGVPAAVEASRVKEDVLEREGLVRRNHSTDEVCIVSLPRVVNELA